MNVTFLSTSKLKMNTPIDDNVDDSIIKPYIYKAQLTHIHQTLGTDLYEKIKTDVVNKTLSGNYKLLMDNFIVPCLIEYAFYEVLPFVSLKITNKGVGRGSADYFSEADLNDVKYLRGVVRDLAEFQNTRLIKHLKHNVSFYPEYFTNSGLDKIIPNSKSYFNGIYLGGGRNNINDCSFGTGEGYIDLN